jgi:hypothetical protein
MIAWKGCFGCLANGVLIWISGCARVKNWPALYRASTHRVHLDLLQSRVTRRPDNLHDLDELVRVVSSSEQRVAGDHLGHAGKR